MMDDLHSFAHLGLSIAILVNLIYTFRLQRFMNTQREIFIQFTKAWEELVRTLRNEQ